MSSRMSRLRRYLSKNVWPIFKPLADRLRQIPKESALLYTTVILIGILAVAVRLLPLRWGIWLDEFDSYYQLRVTQFIADHGILAYFNWHDYTTWYPWGRSVSATVYPGMAIIVANIYLFLKAIGISVNLMFLAGLMPPIFAGLDAILLFFIGKEVDGTITGLFASLFLAFSAADISRTHYGFYKNEFGALLALNLGIFFFIRALKRDAISNSILAGLAIGAMTTMWGGFRYPFGVIALFAVVMVLMGRYSRKLLTVYVFTVGTGLLVSIQLQRAISEFFNTTDALIPVIGFLALGGWELISIAKTRKGRILGATGIVMTIFGALVVLVSLGFLRGTFSRIQATIDPLLRPSLPLVASVGEHQPATWGAFWSDFGVTAILMMFGLYFLVKRRSDIDVFYIIALLSALYFGASLIRLFLILGPIAAVVSGLAIRNFLTPFAQIAREKPPIARRRLRIAAPISRGNGAIVLVLIVLTLSPTLIGAISAAYQPAAIASDSIGGQQFDDWLQALQWIRDNTPQNSVVASWWDYGYWISVVANRTSVTDNATINATQIQLTAKAFMLNETIALSIYHKLGVSYVVVFELFVGGQLASSTGVGDFPKSRWMIQIAGLNLTDYFGQGSTTYPSGIQQNQFVQSAPLYRMLFNPNGDWAPSAYKSLVVAPQHFTLVFESSGLAGGQTTHAVFVYKVNYPTS